SVGDRGERLAQGRQRRRRALGAGTGGDVGEQRGDGGDGALGVAREGPVDRGAADGARRPATERADGTPLARAVQAQQRAVRARAQLAADDAVRAHQHAPVGGHGGHRVGEQALALGDDLPDGVRDDGLGEPHAGRQVPRDDPVPVDEVGELGGGRHAGERERRAGRLDDAERGPGVEHPGLPGLDHASHSRMPRTPGAAQHQGMKNSALHPNLAVSDARPAIAFYEAAFGAEALDVITAGDAVIHSDLVLRSAAGESTFTVAAAFPPDSVAPEADGPTHVSLTVPVADTDAAYGRAMEAGARSLVEPGDWFEGFRQAAVRCPFGHRWYLVTVADSVTAEDVQRASDAWMTEKG